MKCVIAALLCLVSLVASAADFSVIRTYTYPMITEQHVDAKTTLPISGATVIMIKSRYALTAAHALHTSPTITSSILNGRTKVPYKVIKVDKEKDLALIELGIGCPCATILIRPQLPVDEEAWAVGYPSFLKYGIQFVTPGRTQGALDDRIVTTTVAAPGSSGGGLFIRDGDKFPLIGIVVAIGVAGGANEQEHNWITFSVSGQAIKAFLVGTPAELK